MDKTEKLDDVLSMSQRLLVSKRQVHRIKSVGLLPKSHKIGGSLRWISSEVDSWIFSGMPDMRTWGKIKGAVTE